MFKDQILFSDTDTEMLHLQCDISEQFLNCDI